MRLAVIGDIHGFWDARDTAFFNDSDYDALLFVGDLPHLTGGLGIARELAHLDKPAWLIPGNHDGVTAPQLLAELKGWRALRRSTAHGMARRVRRLARAMEPVRLRGFTLETLDDGLGLLVARPHAMGPDKFYYGSYIKRRFGVRDFEDSAETLKSLVAAAPQRLLVLAHNGPAGLGDTPDAPWGCDFSTEFGDFGDPDLRAAIDHAHETGRRVEAVVAGHMHHRSKNGSERHTAAQANGTLYINAACVSRHRKQASRRHHVCLQIDDNACRAETVWVDADGHERERTLLP